MVNGYETLTLEEEVVEIDSTVETNSAIESIQSRTPSIPEEKKTPKTTTIGTIALQNGSTRIVIALLECGEWLRLKVLDVQPELTKLGATPEEARELLNAHDELLLRLQSKQSPVEELLRKADRLIATQKSKADVYKAMAETLGNAWHDVNVLLERRKQILDRNVLFQCRAAECRESMQDLEMACNDTLVPIETEAVKNFLCKIHDLRKIMLERLMGALQEGKILLDRLREIENEGTLDSRPDKIKADAEHAVVRVEKWLEDLHDRRRLIEISFQSRRTQLEQCLALALLATDLRDLENILNNRVIALSNISDHLGDSSGSAELLLYELRKLQIEAKDFQDRALKITKSTERLATSGHFAGEQATKQAYAILGAAADYINELDHYEAMLNRALAFFESSRSAFTKLDQLEIQLVTTEYSARSAGLVRLHSQIAETLENIAVGPLSEGHALLEAVGRSSPGTEGVKKIVGELEDRRFRLLERCTAHKEENVRVSRCLEDFVMKYEELSNWLSSIVESFLRGHRDMGSDLPMAKDFHDVHLRLMTDLENRSMEIRDLDKQIFPEDVTALLDDAEKADILKKIQALQDSWNLSRTALEARLQLGSLYVDFHDAASTLEKEIDLMEEDLKKGVENIDDTKMEEFEKRWNALQPFYVKLTASGKRFLIESSKIVDSYMDVPRACLCVETILDKFSNRQFSVTRTWEEWQSTITIQKERRIEREKRLEESTKTLEWVSKFREQLYPIISCESTRVTDILNVLQTSTHRIVPELNKAVEELNARIFNIEGFEIKGDEPIDSEIRKQLTKVSDHLKSTAIEYKNLLDDLVSIFEKLLQVEKETKAQQESIDSSTALSPESISKVRSLLKQQEFSGHATSDILKRIKQEIERTIGKIRSQEPPQAAQIDVDKLIQALKTVANSWDSSWTSTKSKLEEHLEFVNFKTDLERIDSELADLGEQLGTISGWLGESTQAAKGASDVFNQFEKTFCILEQKIEVFIKNTEDSAGMNLINIQSDLDGLRDRLKSLKIRSADARKKINSSIEYFELLEEAKDWFKEGSKLLIVIARKATTMKVPDDGRKLLQEIDSFLKPGEDKQETRIERIRELSTRIFGTDRLPQFNEVVVENRDMLDCFAVSSSEIRTLVENMKNAEDLREKLKRERDEADARVKEAKAEVTVAQAAAAEAETARKLAERLAAETLEKAAEEARRIVKIETEAEKARERNRCVTTSAQTDVMNAIDERIVHETVTSNVTTKEEVHITKMTEIEHYPIPDSKEDVQEEVEILTEIPNTVDIDIPLLLEEDISAAPQIILPIYDATIQEGEKFTFECRVIGNPEPEILWYKNGQPIAYETNFIIKYDQGICTLVVEKAQADSALFMCKATNVHGSAQTEARLNVKEKSPEEQSIPPLFVKLLQPSAAIEGTAHQLECTVQGNPLPTVQWYKNETNIDNSPDYITTYNNGDAVLKFEEVFLDDQGTYACKAANIHGQDSTSAFLSVEPSKPKEPMTQKPQITSSPTDVMVKTGETVILECEASGIPPPDFVWTQNGQSLEESKTIQIRSDAGRSSLVVASVYPKDAGSYVVTARNIAGEETASCNVSVKGRLPASELPCPDMEPSVPSIQLPLKDLRIPEGASVRLDCVIIGQPEPEVIWYFNDRPVKESADFQLLFQGDRCSLVIHEAFLDDAGVYKVVAINTGGEASSECTLTITPRGIEATECPPKFVKLLTDLLIAEGEGAIFECIVSGEPKPEVTWWLNSEAVVENDRIKITMDQNGTSTLKISPTNPEDKGNYVAKATNRLGEAKAFARLVVKVLDFQLKDEIAKTEEKLMAPYFKEKFEDRKVPEGTSTKFECIAVGKPLPKIQWFFNNRTVHGKDFLVSVSGDRQVLTIPEVGNAHAGTVSCVAENTAGKASCDAKVEVEVGREAAEEGLVELIQVPANVDEMQASNSTDKYFTKETTTGQGGSENQVMTKMSSMFTESSTTHTSSKQEYISSTTSSSLGKAPGYQPSSLCLKKSSQSAEHACAHNGAPPVVQSHKIEEFERITQNAPGEIRQEKTVIVTEDAGGTRKQECKQQVQIQKPCRKTTAPRFVSPVTGMIVDQGSNVVLEGIIDGFPPATVAWTKNGQELKPKDGARLSYEHNHVRLELKDVKVKDAGRYTCTATNEVGSSSSTADLVVKKTIFPPVFGRRLQAQVVKKGDRVIMEVEITGTPEPTVTWYKDDIPISASPPEIRMKQQGNCYLMLIDKAEKSHAGKYMVRATNAGGEAQSIADFAVFEPTPDTMVEVHKTLFYENVQDKDVKKSQTDEKKTQIPGGNLTSQLISTTMITPSAQLKTPIPSTSSSCTIRTIKSEESSAPLADTKATRSEMISSTVESQRTETKSEQKFHMKLEHKSAPFMETSFQESSEVRSQDQFSKMPEDNVEVVENENVETSTVARKDALNFFESMSKGSEVLKEVRGPKEMVKLPTEDDGTGPGYDVKVDKLTKEYERTTRFEEAPRETPKSDFKSSKKAVQDIFNKFEKGGSSRGIDNSMFDFPYEEYKLPPLECKRTILEDVTASGSPIHGTLTISKLEAQSESAEAMLQGFNLVPEPPPEMGYAPKVEEVKKKRPDVSIKAKQLQESFDNSISPVDAPIGGVKTFPSAMPTKVAPKSPKTPEKTPICPLSIPPPYELGKSEIVEETCIKKDIHEKKESKVGQDYTKTSSFDSSVTRSVSPYREQFSSTEYSSHAQRSTSPKPSADGIIMEKSWAHKQSESSRKSWPPARDTTKIITDKEEWSIPEQGYRAMSSENRQEMELKPEGRCTTTSIESSSLLEKKAWGSKETRISEKVHEPPPEPKPITYKAETVKVDHTVNTIEEKSIVEKYTAECDVRNTQSAEKIIEAFEKRSSRSLPDTLDLKAPSLVKCATDTKKPVVQLYHQESESILEPGPPPEMGFIPGPAVKETKFEMLEKTLERSCEHKPAKIPPGAVRTIPPPTQHPKKKFEERKDDIPSLPVQEVRISPPSVPIKQPVCQPQTINKVTKSSFYSESDYESELDGCLKTKFRSCESDSETLYPPQGYRRVKAPVSTQPCRPVSTESEPLPPSSFEVPPASFTGPPRPVVTPEPCEKTTKQTSMSRQEKDVKQYQKISQQTVTNLPQAGSPPVYIQPSSNLTPRSPTTKLTKPESPKFKTKVFQKESGYMADTEESRQKLQEHKSFSESCSSFSETKSSFMESKSYSSSQNKKDSSSSDYSYSHSQSNFPQTQTQHSSFVEKIEETTPQMRYKPSVKESVHTMSQMSETYDSKKKSQMPQCPSRFVKGEYRESDYESDYDARIPSMWKPRPSSTESTCFKPVKPSFTSAGKPLPAETFVSPSPAVQTTETLKETKSKRAMYHHQDEKPRPKSVLLPGTPPEIAYAPPRQSYYEGRIGTPFHNAIGTETKKTVRMDESTENTRRVVTVQQTSRVIKFGENSNETSSNGLSSSSQKQSTAYSVPIPKKFVQGQFRESDYESDVDTSRIRAKWAPPESDTEEPRYRKVSAPRPKSPVITWPSESENERSENEKRFSYMEMRSRKTGSQDILKPGSPPEFAYSSGEHLKKTANHVASRHMSDMTSTFKSKTEKFVNDIQSDLKTRSKPILKQSSNETATTDSPDNSRTYREESRLAQYGTKHIDPDTGLIYFKYDFGYEFGIILPGEGKRIVSSSSQNVQGQRKSGDIEVPIVHEFTRKENGFPKRGSNYSTTNSTPVYDRQIGKNVKFGKTAKWDPTSESEFSEAEDFRTSRRHELSVPPRLLIPASPSPRWDPTTPSPISLSPSLPSLSPHYSIGPPSNVDSAGSPWPSTNGHNNAREIVQPYIEILPKRAPLFITPLRDIAVVSGQPARFECIVQAEPQPNILWSKDGRIIENSVCYEVYYRNGVCRLTLPRTCPGSAGTFACTATNNLGSTVTTATLQVPGNRRSIYGIN